jgi:hypothetical protein
MATKLIGLIIDYGKSAVFLFVIFGCPCKNGSILKILPALPRIIKILLG